LLYPVKKVLRRLMRFYVEPFAADQRAFNDAALKLVDELFEEVDLAYGRLDRAERELAERREDARRVAELEERLTRVERRPARRGRTARLLRLRGPDARPFRGDPRAPARLRRGLPRRRARARRRLRP